VLAERIDGARSQIELLDKLGIRQGLAERREWECARVIEWVNAHPEASQTRAEDRTQRLPSSEFRNVQIYRRDAFTCKYARCRKRTVHGVLLREIASVFPDLLGTHPNWYALDQHIVYWTCTATLEHRIALAFGGADIDDNCLTGCSQCQYAKYQYPLADTVWIVDDPDASMPTPEQEAERWDGLSWSLAPLRLSFGRPLGNILNGRPLSSAPKPGSVVRRRSRGPLYYVEALDGDSALVHSMWTSGGHDVIAKRSTRVVIVPAEWMEALPALPLPQ
jgi:hypothetical protein